MDISELVRQMDRAERMWPDERPWSVQVLAGYLHASPSELLALFKQINPAMETERDQVLPEDLRLLRAHCERMLEVSVYENTEDKRKAQVKARRTIQSLCPKIAEMVVSRDHTRALNSYVYLLGESGDYALPEEKAQWYEEMGRLSLKAKRHPNEAARYFKSAVNALSLLEDIEGIRDLLETYEEDFQGDEARKCWESVVFVGKDSMDKLSMNPAE